MIFGKVMWMARATTTVVGLAIMLALVFGVASTALGANGNNFILGSLNNAATAITKLTGNVNGPAMQVVNTNADANDTALDLRVQSGEAPMRVNSNKKVANLNADRIDDREASSFADGVGGKATNADKLDGLDSAAFAGFGETAYSGIRFLDECGGTTELESIPFSVSRPSLIYASGVARYGKGSSNFTMGTISVELRDADDNTQLASGGYMSTDTGERLSPISLQGVLHSGTNIYFDPPEPFVATPGQNYVLRLTGSASNGSCTGDKPAMSNIALSYVLLGTG